MDRISVQIALMVLLLALVVTALTVGPRVVPGDAFFGDKVQHALGFGAIVAPAAFLRPRWLLWLAPATIIFGGLIEVIQSQVGRDGDLWDWIADVVGVLIVSVTLPPLRFFLERRGFLRRS